MIRSAAQTLDAAAEAASLSISGGAFQITSAIIFLKSTSATTPVFKIQAKPAGVSDWIDLGWVNLSTLTPNSGGAFSASNSTDYTIVVPNLAWATDVRVYLDSIVSGSYSATVYGLDESETQDMNFPVSVINSAVAQAITSTSATAFTVGRQGSTTPAFQVDANAGSSVTGWKVTAGAVTAGAAFTVISSGTNEPGTIDAKGSGVLSLNTTATGQIYMSRGAKKAEVAGRTVTALGTAQNSTPTIAQLLTGIVTQTSSTGSGTVTLPTGTLISAGMPLTPATGDTFEVIFCNLGGGQNLVITGDTGSTVVGEATVASATGRKLVFTCTGTNAWTVICC